MFINDALSVVDVVKLLLWVSVLLSVVLFVLEKVLLTVMSGPLLYRDSVASESGLVWVMSLLW